jgi:capsular polysaccharide biosynthesis protein
MNWKTFLAAIRMYWKTFLVVASAVLALGLAWLILTPRQYATTAQLLVTIQGSTTTDAYQNDEVVAGRVDSYIALLTSDVVSQRVINKLGLPRRAHDLAAKVSATRVPPSTSVIDVEVTADSPEQARELTDTLAQEFVSYTAALETPTGQDSQKVKTTIISGASEPRPRITEYVALGGLVVLAALLLGAVAVWIRSATDRVVRMPNRAAAAAGVPVLGCVTSTAAASVAELYGYRRVRSQLRSTQDTSGGRVLELASVDSAVDATTVATNLGRAMELAGSRSVVVDANTPDSPVPPASPIDEQHGVRERRQPVRGAKGFPDTLSAAGWGQDPDGIVTKQVSSLVEQLRDKYECVIIAAPPMLSTLAASEISDYVDSVLLLVSLGRTKRRDVSQAAASLRETGAPLMGVVVVQSEGLDAGLHLRLWRKRSTRSAPIIRRPCHDDDA